MPFGSPQIIYQLIDADSGDDSDLWNPNDFLAERLVGFEFSDHESKKDQATFTFRNDDFALLDVPAFVRGQKYLITWGWPGRLSPPRRMVVVKITGGNPLVVKMHDTTTLLDRKKNHRFWSESTDSEFVRDVAAEHGYRGPTLHVEETTVRRDITQPQWRTDARQLAWLAKRNGFIFYVDAGGLHWHSRNWNAEPVRTYLYRRDPAQGAVLSEPTFEANLTRGVSTVRVLARDPLTKEDIDITVGPSSTDMVSLGNELETADPEGGDAGRRAARVTREDVRYLGFMTRQAAEAEAQARYRETAQKRYKMTVDIMGDAQLGAKQLIEFYGVSTSLDGLYYLREVTHSIQGGQYTCRIEGMKDAQREVRATKKAARARRSNANANKNPSDASIVAARELEELRKTATLQYGPDGIPVVVWYYVDDQNQTVVNSLTPGELRDLGLRAKNAIAREAAGGVLPDA